MRSPEDQQHTKKDGESKRDYQAEKSHYSDKGGHKERSNANQPQHSDHWKKEERKR